MKINLANMFVEGQDSRVGYARRGRGGDDGIPDWRRQDHSEGSERCTSSEAAMIVRSVTELDGPATPHSRRTLRRLFGVQRDCIYPTARGKWKKVMTELGVGAKVPELWRMLALPEMCPQEVKDEMLVRLNEIGENYDMFSDEGDLMLLQQGRTDARGTSRHFRSDGCQQREPQREGRQRLGGRG